MANKYRFIGKVTPRIDASEIVTGKARFLNDIKLADMLYGKVLRSPHPHALITKLDKSKAEATPRGKGSANVGGCARLEGGYTPLYAHP